MNPTLSAVIPVLLTATTVTAEVHTFVGTGEMRSNPERGFRDELHGACTGEWGPGRTGLSDDDMDDMKTMNLTIAQVRAVFKMLVLLFLFPPDGVRSCCACSCCEW